MSLLLSPEKSPASFLAPGLSAAVVCSAVLAYLQAAYGTVSQDMELSGAALVVLSGIFGAFGGFLTVLVHAVLIWVYGRAWQPVRAGFVRTLAVVAVALGVTFVLQLILVGAEVAVTDRAPARTAADLSRHLGSGSVSFDLVNLVTVGLICFGARRYLGYGAWATGVLAVLMLALNVAAGAVA